MLLSSIPSIRVWRFFTGLGWKQPSRPRGTESGVAPSEPFGHARRRLIEITRTGPAPIAEAGVTLIRDLYAIEADIGGKDPATRLASHQARSAAIITRIDDWRHHQRARAAAKPPRGEALTCKAPTLQNQRPALVELVTQGVIEQRLLFTAVDE